MKIHYTATGRSLNLSAVATPSQYSVFPILQLTATFEDGKQNVYDIQSANWGLPGYYVRTPDAGIVDGYLPGDYDEPMNLKNLPELVVKRLVRSYTMITLANIFSKRGWAFEAHTYNNHHFPDEMEKAINDFVDLEYERIMR